MSVGKSRDGQAVAVPARLERAAAAEEVDHRDVGERHVGCRHADLHDGAREVARVERLLQHLGPADGFDAQVGAVAVGERADRLDRVFLRRVDGVRRAETERPFELPRVDGRRAMIVRAPASRAAAIAALPTPPQPNTATVSSRCDAARVRRGAEAGHHAATEQPGRGRDRRARRPSSPGPRRRASSPRTHRCRARARAACRRRASSSASRCAC